jgi:hypothetical protein
MGENMFDKLIFSIFIVSLLFSCQNRRVVTETEFNNPAQNLTDMLKTMRAVDSEDSSLTENHKRVATEIEFNNPPKNLIDMLNMMDSLDGVVSSRPESYNRGNKEVFEDTVWRSSNTLLLDMILPCIIISGR